MMSISNGRKPMTAMLQKELLISWSKAIINFKKIICNPCIEFFGGIMDLFYLSGTSHFFGQNLLLLKTYLLDHNSVVCLLSFWLVCFLFFGVFFFFLVPPVLTCKISFILHLSASHSSAYHSPASFQKPQGAIVSSQLSRPSLIFPCSENTFPELAADWLPEDNSLVQII